MNKCRMNCEKNKIKINKKIEIKYLTEYVANECEIMNWFSFVTACVCVSFSKIYPLFFGKYK